MGTGIFHRTIATGLAVLALLASSVEARQAHVVHLKPDDLVRIRGIGSPSDASCELSYYYLIGDCAYVTVYPGIENHSIGVHFNMTDVVPWLAPCDTNRCLTLDEIEIVLYYVLPPGNDQSMNVKVFAADENGEPVGSPLGNRDFEPAYVDTTLFPLCRIDFTNEGSVPGLDLSGCGGNFVVLLTWKNDTGHPYLVLDNVSWCVDSCTTNPVCCQMGSEPYIYPRTTIHTYDYGVEGSWSKGPAICDPKGCSTYGPLEALWTCRFCTLTPATQPTTWGTIKALYR